MAGKAGNLTLSLFVTAWLARRLQPEGFGIISFALALLSYFVIVAQGGLQPLGIREIAKDGGAVQHYLRHIQGLQILQSLLACGLLSALAGLVPASILKKEIILGYAISLLLYPFQVDWAFQGLGKMGAVAAITFLQGALYAISVIWLVRGPQGIHWVPIAYFAGLCAQNGIYMFWAVRRFGAWLPAWDWAVMRKMLASSLPMCFSMAMIAIYYNMDSVLLGVLKGDSAVGSYNAAYKIVFVLLVLPTLYNQSMAPAISALAVRSAPKLARLLDGSVRLALVVALPLAVGGTFLARQIIGLLYGTGYEPAIPALQVLVWAAAVSYLSCLFGTTVLYTGLERAYMVGVTLGAVVNTALNLLLIPWFDLRGAAVATVVAELAVAVWMYRSVRRVIRGSLLVHLWPAAVACVPMVLMLFLTLGWALGYRLALGVLSYFTAVVLTGGIRIADLHMLTSSADPNQSPAAAVQFSRT